MKHIILPIVILSSMSLAIGWLFKPQMSLSQKEKIRLDNEFKLLCKRYTMKSNRYIEEKKTDLMSKKALVYYDIKIKKYCKAESKF